MRKKTGVARILASAPKLFSLDGIKKHDCMLKNQESRIKNQESRIKNQESRTKNLVTRLGKHA